MDDFKVICGSEEQASKTHFRIQQDFLDFGMLINEKKCWIFTKGIENPHEMKNIPIVNEENH